MPTDPAERPDLQIAVEQGAIRRPGLLAITCSTTRTWRCCRPAPAGRASNRSISCRLAGERWVDNDFARGWCRKNLIEACHAAGFSPPFHVEAHDYPTAMAFVAAGIGLTVLPTLGARQLPPGVVAVPVTRPTPVRSIYALVREGVVDTPAVRTVLRVLTRLGARAAGRTADGALRSTR